MNLYGVIMTLIGNLHVGRHSDRGTLSPGTPAFNCLGDQLQIDMPLEEFDTFSNLYMF